MKMANNKIYSVIKDGVILKNGIKNLVSAKELAKKENAEIYCDGVLIWGPEAEKKPVKYRLKTLLNVRKEPSLESEILRTMNAGTVVDVLEIVDDWLKIGKGAYVFSNGGIFAEEICNENRL